MKTYQEYFDEWQISTESRDLAFDEWLMLQLDRKEKQMIDNLREWIRDNSYVPFDYYNDCDGREKERVIEYYELLKWLKSIEK